jgi:hypothetical protein
LENLTDRKCAKATIIDAFGGSEGIGGQVIFKQLGTNDTIISGTFNDLEF